MPSCSVSSLCSLGWGWNVMWISSKWVCCRRWISLLFERWRIGTNDASFSSLSGARCENFMWSLPLSMWVFTIPNIVLILTFSGTNVPLGITVSADFFAWIPLISFLILRFSVLMAWSSAAISSLIVTFLWRAIGVRGVRVGSSSSLISILSSSYFSFSRLP